MEFNYKFNKVLELLNTTNSNIARASSLSTSIISCYKNGQKLPKKNSAPLQQLCHGIENIAKKVEKTDAIVSLCENNSSSINDLYTIIFNWLNESLEEDNNINTASNDNKIIYFGERLTQLKDIFKLSNAQMAKQLNVDASLISKYCSGKRIPKKSNPFIMDICSYFVYKPKTQKQDTELLELLKIEEESNEFTDEAVLCNELYNWLTKNETDDDNMKDINDMRLMNDFLYSLDTINAKMSMIPLPYDRLVIDITDLAETKTFWGIAGIREAVVCFLSKAIQAPPSSEPILLYSDQNTDWMTNDNFTYTWASLMFYTLHNKHRIIMTHHLNRDLAEMLAAIKNWLPFYITGLIEPYCCKKPNGDRFHHTMFIAPGIASVTSFGVLDDDENTSYVLDNKPEAVERYTKRYKAFLNKCENLMTIFTKNNANNYLHNLEKFDSYSSDFTGLYYSLSIYTMPESLLNSILDRNNIEEERRQQVMSFYRERRSNFLNIITKNHFKDICIIHKRERLANSNIHIDIPCSLIDKKLFYTVEEYEEHIKAIEDIIKQYSNYSFCILPVNPLVNIQIKNKKSGTTYFGINDENWVVFEVNNNILNNAFTKYLNMLEKSSQIITKSNFKELYSFM